MSELEELKEIEHKALYGQNSLVPPPTEDVRNFVDYIQLYLNNKSETQRVLDTILSYATNALDEEDNFYFELKDSINEIISCINNCEKLFAGCNHGMINSFRHYYQILHNIEDYLNNHPINVNFQCVLDCVSVVKLFDVGERSFIFDCDVFQVISNLRAIQNSKRKLYDSEKSSIKSKFPFEHYKFRSFRKKKRRHNNYLKKLDSYSDELPIIIIFNMNGEAIVFEFEFYPTSLQPLNGVINSMNQHYNGSIMYKYFYPISYPKNPNEYNTFKDNYFLKMILLAFEVVRRDCENDKYKYIPVISCLLMLEEISLIPKYNDALMRFWTNDSCFHIFSGLNRYDIVRNIIITYKRNVLNKVGENIDFKECMWNILKKLNHETVESILMK